MRKRYTSQSRKPHTSDVALTITKLNCSKRLVLRKGISNDSKIIHLSLDTECHLDNVLPYSIKPHSQYIIYVLLFIVSHQVAIFLKILFP